MRTSLLCVLGLTGLVGVAVAVRWEPALPAAAASPAQELRTGGDDVHGPGPAALDAFHPDREPAEPRRGGRVSVHVNVMPASLCFPIENSTYARNVLYEVHETLLFRDWETWEWRPSLARERTVERRDDGAVAYTYRLREDVVWHPVAGFEDHRLDARDVAFSFSIYANPHVRCDEKRYQFEDIACEVLDAHTLRFTYPEPYFREDQALAAMTILPSHLYDLTDPDHPDYDPDASPEERARAVNENPHNRAWIGLGPFRVVEFTDEYIEAERFDDYFDPARGGYLDRIRWRRVGDAAAFEALLEGELDFTSRLSSEDYFERAKEEAFTARFYRGYYPTGVYGAVVWNLHRQKLSDPRVRRAFAHAFDFETFRRTQYRGLATQITGPLPFFSLAYDRTLEPYPFDRRRAEELLDEAGWYDRDGDGLRDREGEPLVIEYLSPAGSRSSLTLGLKLQEDLGLVGVGLELRELDFAAWRERQKQREFDATPIGWNPPLEPDPAQLWHSSNGAPGVESSNHSGLQDEEVDRLIALIHGETDDTARIELWHALHRRLYELQPFLFLYNVPARFAMNRRVRGFQSFLIEPGYSIRRWYVTE